MAKTQTLSFPQGASYLIPFQCRSRGSTPANYTGWKILFVVKKNLTDSDDAALINQLIVPASDTGYNELLLNGDETYEFPVGRYYYQAVVVDATGTVGKSEVGLFVVEETTLRSNAGTYVGPNPPLNPPATAGLIFNARQPIYLDITLITSSGMSAAIYDPQHIQADVFDADNHTDGVTKKVMTAAERTKLAGIAAGATANNTDAYLLNRANHSGSQAISTITGLQAALDSKPDNATLTAHINNTSNPHVVTKSQVGLGSADNTADSAKNVLSATRLTNARTINGVSFDGTANITLVKADIGLGNVDNTADANKPISTATQTALDTKVNKTATPYRVYGTNSAGSELPMEWAWTPNTDSIARRGVDGTLQVGTPAGANNATTKAYVDAANNVKSDKTSTFAIASHGTNASLARPATYGGVIWRGSVEPIYRLPGDLWVSDSLAASATTVVNQSTNPSAQTTSTGSPTVEVRRNYHKNPSITGNVGGIFSGASQYVGNGGTSTGSFSVASNVQTINAETLTGTTKRFGLFLGTINPSIPTNGRLTLSAQIQSLLLGTGVTAKIYMDCYLGATYVGGVSNSFSSTGIASCTYTAASAIDRATCYIWLESATDWAGTASVSFTKILAEYSGAVLPWFDGSNNTWQSADLTNSWVGAANNSESILTGERPGGILSAYGNPIWLSTDGALHGTKFARTIVNRIGPGGAYVYNVDTTGTTALETVTHGLSVRVSRSVPVVLAFTSTDTNGGQGWTGVSGQTIAANTWTEYMYTGAPIWDNAGNYAQVASANVEFGDLIDFDRHYVVKGTYSGGYFDGSTAGYSWTGTANDSTSTGARFTGLNYFPTSGGVLNGDLVVTGTTNGVRQLSGSGAPNGIVTAAVGAEYTDVARTNGAYKWRKDTGSGNTGWICIEGDTGERDITPGTLPSGVVSTSLRIQRVRNDVHIWTTNTEISSAAEIILLASLPDGFKPRVSATPNQSPFAPGTSNTGGVAVNRNSNNGLRIQSSVGQFRTFYITYLTPDAWPTTLPGTAA